MGRNLEHFAAFFSRRARENDYLWGRLHAADRLVDIVVSAGLGARVSADKFNPIKARLFRAILEAERPFLSNVRDLIADIERDIATKFDVDMAEAPKTSEAAD